MPGLRSFPAWDAGVRWFHWINVLCVIGLIAAGVVILNDAALGLGNDGKVILKTVHVWIGYVLVLNLLWRLVWAFIGGTGARWRAFLPGGRGYFSEVRNYFAAWGAGRPLHYQGHTPPGRLAISALLLVLLVMSISGLILAGTDLFFPPLGRWIAGWVAAPGVDPGTLLPYSPDMYDAAAYAAMRSELRSPVIRIHYWGFYTLLGLVVVHIAAVVITEIRGRGNLISAMFTGRKIMEDAPADQQRGD